ncbi:stalk domain-containing protein [Paenibacillus methanolicus]|uniref:Copper amine oxidase-like protein n=1 Tax=Paenibacillus methanolicus TaxID=582686 RepID=A0A5S5BQ93_9BACL|nr:stalk domain-containing protein [Paenibacillus methanolicus]TYP67713.1 copper amine oxidase-like protein [Paenibacillus methanolicus]
MKVKWFISFLVVCISLFGTNIALAKSERIALMINGEYITTGAGPAIINNSTYLPLRNLFENIGFTVEYYPQFKSAVAWYTKGEFRLAFALNSKTVEIDSTLIKGNSTTAKISNSAISYNNAVYVPIRAFADLLGANVRYDKFTSTVLFNVSDSDIKKSIYPRIGVSTGEETTTVESPKKMSAKEIAKLMDRVGYVEAYDQNGSYASGSGFLLGNGLFITNSHVAHDANGILVKLGNDVYDSEGWFLFDNTVTDLFGLVLSSQYSSDGRAIGKIPEQYIDYNTELPEIGDKVFAIGSPQGLENTISEGIVSGIRKDKNDITLIQHTADIDHGSSGGVLLNEYGQAIGVTSSGIEGSNLEFAIPMKYVQDELTKIVK